MNEITIGDKTYISSKRAAEITGYAKDYVGQLCREGHIEAKMVGRGWYVFEPSIRAHRFGEPIESLKEEPKTPDLTPWEAPVYKAEPVAMLPELEEQVQEVSSATRVGVVEEKILPKTSDDTLTDMQAAWREWFERKQPLVTEASEGIEEPVKEENETPALEMVFETLENEDDIAVYEEEIAIPMHRIDSEGISEVEEDVQAEEVAIHRVQPIELPKRVVKAKKGSASRARKLRNKQVTHAPVIALLVALALISVVIAMIGTGYADGYIETLVGNNALTNFLVGNSTYIR